MNMELSKEELDTLAEALCNAPSHFAGSAALAGIHRELPPSEQLRIVQRLSRPELGRSKPERFGQSTYYDLAENEIHLVMNTDVSQEEAFPQNEREQARRIEEEPAANVVQKRGPVVEEQAAYSARDAKVLKGIADGIIEWVKQ